MKIGLVVEGGGMKCAYNAAILDAFLDHNITFAYCIGASGGFGNLASDLAGQRGRNLRFLTEHIHNPGYLGLRSFLKTGNLFGLVSNALRLRFFKRRHGSAVSDNTAETTASVTTESPVQKISVNNRRATLDYVFEYSDGRRVCAVFDFRNNTKEYTDTGMEHYESLQFYCVPDFSLESYEKIDDGAFDSAMLTLTREAVPCKGQRSVQRLV